jgi:hypothetical protein
VAQPVDSEAFIERLPDALGERVRRWAEQPRIQGCATTASCAWPS